MIRVQNRDGRRARLSRCFAVFMVPSVVLGFMALAPSYAYSAELKIYTSGAPAEVERAVVAQLPVNAGDSVKLTVANLKVIQDRLSAGEEPDVVILPSSAMDALERKGALLSGSRVELARVGIGMIVKEGASIPDISTEAAFRDTVLHARSIVYPDPKGGGFTGAHIDLMIGKMGIADVSSKISHMFAIRGGVSAVASGESEIGIFNISEVLNKPGIQFVGPLPASLQNYIVFSGAIFAHSASPTEAKVFLSRLTDEAGTLWKDGGFEQSHVGF